MFETSFQFQLIYLFLEIHYRNSLRPDHSIVGGHCQQVMFEFVKKPNKLYNIQLSNCNRMAVFEYNGKTHNLMTGWQHLLVANILKTV